MSSTALASPAINRVKFARSRLDGIVGYNFLRKYKVVIDYPNELFRLE